MRAVARCILAALLCSAAGSPAFAGGPPAEPAKPVATTVLYLPEPGVSPREVARASLVFHQALRQNHRINLQDSDKLLAEFAGDVPEAQLQRASQACAEGTRLLRAGQIDEAIDKLKSGIDTLVEIVPFIRKRALADAMLALGVAYAERGDVNAALSRFEELLTWRPTMRFDANRFDVRYATLFEKAKKRLEDRPRGSIEIKTVPGGAKAFVDGQFVGVTPTIAFGLLAGTHYATFKKAGFVKAGMPIEVSSREQLSYAKEMRRSEKYLLLKQALRRARAELGRKRAGPAIADIGRVLFVDQLILTTLRPASSSQLDAQAYLYDMRSRALLKQVRMSVARTAPKTMEDVARLLYLGVRYDGSLEAPPEEPPPARPEASPVYTRWWLWAAVAAGLAAGAAAVALPLALQESPCPNGNRCAILQN